MNQHLSQYKIFYEVAKAGNISRAAKQLYISQPAISKAISKLEDGLEVSLFSRNSRGVSLTDEGMLLFEHIETAFNYIESGEAQLTHMKELQIGKIRIGTSNTLCRYLLMPYLSDFVTVNPHVMINIFTQSSSDTLDFLTQRNLDIGLVALASAQKHLAFKTVMKIQDTFVATPGYMENLALRSAGENPLSSGNLMLLDKDNATRQYIDTYFNQNSIKTNQLLEVNSMDLLIEFANAGIGIACVIKEFVKEELQTGKLIEIALPAPIKKRLVGFAYQAENPNPALKRFLSRI